MPHGLVLWSVFDLQAGVHREFVSTLIPQQTCGCGKYGLDLIRLNASNGSMTRSTGGLCVVTWPALDLVLNDKIVFHINGHDNRMTFICLLLLPLQ